ncbi:zinc-finger domain-containing protein [Acidocella sp.]|uniref:zinc-finger domain-containing protein n=1 Tax=Acidocella sp. TaxID=50710 RepID=UPI00260C6682|nr:zinc-finger domain-containing protein [Acidocella sp.]
MSVQTDAINATEIFHVKSHTVSCDGGTAQNGHPLVYLRILDKQVACPYCSRIFILEEGVTDSSH